MFYRIKNHVKMPIIRVEPTGTEREFFIRKDELLLSIIDRVPISIPHLRKHLSNLPVNVTKCNL